MLNLEKGETADKDPNADFRVKADFYATVERLLGGQEIIKVAHRGPTLNHPGNTDLEDVKFGNLKDLSLMSEELPGWLEKIYENMHSQKDQTLMNPAKVEQSFGFDHFKDSSFHPEEKSDGEGLKIQKIMDSEIVRSIENFVKLRSLERNLKSYELLKKFTLEEKLLDVLVKFKSLLIDRPKHWNEKQRRYLATIKSFINQLERLLEVDEISLKKSVSDNLMKSILIFEFMKSLQNLKEKLRLWEEFSKLNDNRYKSSLSSTKNDDIIILGQAVTKSNSDKDEL